MQKTISIVGLGKLGSSMVAAYASKGFDIIGVDINQDFVNLLNQGKPPVQETNLEKYLTENKERISATQDYKKAVLNSEITFIIVPTPSKENGDFSTEYAVNAVKEIGKALKEKEKFHVVVLTSTVTPGSTEKYLQPVLEEYSGKKCGIDFGLCYNPEFIALGSIIENLLNPDFTLVGVSDEKSGQILSDFYEGICPGKPIKLMNIVNAEITKISLNTYVTTKISYANMISELCENIPGGDANVVTNALGSDTRIGHKYLKGATGYGGPCFPRDNRALMYTAKKFGVDLPIAKATDEINKNQIIRLTNLIESVSPNNGKVGFLGLSYKPHTHVIEESQPVMASKMLSEKGVEVFVYDPSAMDNAKKTLDKVHFADSFKECINASDVVVISTAWPEFKNIDPADLKQGNKKTIIDCWGMFPDNCKELVIYISLGVYHKV